MHRQAEHHRNAPALTRRRAAGAIFPLLLSCLVAGTLAAKSPDERFVEGLCQRRLFSLAETYCRDCLDDEGLAEADRAQMAVELARTYAQHALNCPPRDRPPLWRQAHQVAAEFTDQHRRAPRRGLGRLQDALTHLARGELGRQETELAAAGAAPMDTARRELRAAIELLGTLDADIARRLTRQGRSSRDPPRELSRDELFALRNNIAYQLARALRNQALSYAADSADRINSLQGALEQLRPLTRMKTTDALVWQSRLDEIVCHRLLKDASTADQRLAALRSSSPPPAIRLRGRAERIRHELAVGRPRDALKTARRGREIGGQTSPELDFAVLQTYVSLWQAAGDRGNDKQALAWQAKAAGTARMIEDLYGPYWMRRAESLLADTAVGSSGAGNLEVLRRTAQNFYRRRQWDEAVDAYRQAAEKAVSQGQTDRAFDLLYMAAAVEHQRPRHQQALVRFRQLALSMPEHPKAPDAHLLAVLNASLLARQQPASSLDQYTALIDEHLSTWPAAATAAKARLWLGRLREHRQDWGGALDANRGISAEFEQYKPAVRAAGRCCLRWLEGLKTAGQPYHDEAGEAARYFERILLGPDNRLPEQLNETARIAALTAARVWLRYAKGGFTDAEDVLTSAIDRSPNAPAAWKSEARLLLVRSLAGQARYQGAKQLLRRIADDPPEMLLELLVDLSHDASEVRPAQGVELAKLKLAAVELVGPIADRLPPSDRATLGWVHAEALAATDRSGEALRMYERLTETYPDDGRVQQGYASLLLAGEDDESVQLALTQWRRVLRRSKPRSQGWYRAKYSTALAHYKLGNKQQAATMIRLAGALYPDLGGEKMEAQFCELLQRCEN